MRNLQSKGMRHGRRADSCALLALQTVRTVAWLAAAVACCVLLPTTAAAGEDQTDVDHIVLGKDATAADITVHTRRQREILKLVREALDERGAEAKARIDLQWKFTHVGGYQASPTCVVPIDEAGRPDGVARHVIHYGRVVTKTVPWQHGERHGIEKHFRDKTVVRTVMWKNGKRAGPSKIFYPSGALRSEMSYVADQAQGKVTDYAEDGTVLRTGTMRDGARHGEFVDYWPETGKKKRVATYREGRVEGVVQDFDKDGALLREMPFQNNRRHGIQKTYQGGDVVERTYYWEGEEVPERAYELKAGETK